MGRKKKAKRAQELERQRAPFLTYGVRPGTPGPSASVDAAPPPAPPTLPQPITPEEARRARKALQRFLASAADDWVEDARHDTDLDHPITRQFADRNTRR